MSEKRIAVATDSNSGVTQKQAAELGLFVLPMPFMINEVEYFEDISLTQNEFYERLQGGADVITSQPSTSNVTQFWDDILKDYDELVYIPMSSGLSGSCETATMLSNTSKYEDRVFVANNQRISVTQRQSALDALELIKRGMSGREVRDFLENDKFNSSIYIMLDTLYYLKKGGRITPAAAAIGSLLKLKPVLQIQGEKLDAFAKARTISSGKSIMINAIKNDIATRFGGSNSKVNMMIAYTYDYEAALSFKEEIEKEFPDCGEIILDPLSLSVACHIGPGALAIAVSQKI